MRSLRPPFFLLFALFLPFHHLSAESPAKKSDILLPIAFEENGGQFEPATRFLVRNAGGTVHFLDRGPEFVLGKAKDSIQVELEPEIKSDKTRLTGEEAMPGKVNYFLGNEAAAHFQGIPTYRRVLYRDFMPGVDLAFYGTQSSLEHDFILAPGINPSTVRFRMRGAESIQIANAGELSIHTKDSAMLLKKPFAYQVVDGKRVKVTADFLLAEDGIISFQVGKYDRNQELIIDPVLVFSTYLDGTQSDIPSSITTDSSGNIYIGGSTISRDFPTTANAYQSICGNCTGGSLGESGYIAKLDPTGRTLLYSTYFVGNGATDIYRIKVDKSGNIIGAGTTESTNFPRVGNYSGGSTNGLFLFSLNAAGTALNHSEIVGRSDDPMGGASAFYSQHYGLHVDNDSNVYVAGIVSVGNFSVNYPVTSGTYSSGRTFTSNQYAVFVTKLSSDGSLIYSTVVPPANGQSVSMYMGGFAVDSNGNTYVSGTAEPGLMTTNNTVSPSYPTSVGGNVAYNGKAGFVLALDSMAKTLLFSTYLPGTNNANTLSLASDGSLYVAGTTSEPSLPVSVNAFQLALKSGSVSDCTCNGGYVLRLNSTGTRILNATYLSGTSAGNNVMTQYGSSAFDSAGNIYLGGLSMSNDYVMVNPIVSFLDITRNIWAGGTVLAGLSPDLSRLIFGSYFNGDGAGDRIVDMAISNNRMLITGGTFADTNFITTAGVFQPNAPAKVNPGVGYPHQFVASIDLNTAAPSVCASPRGFSFGLVSVGTTVNGTTTLTNCGNSPLVVSTITSDSSFLSVTPTSANLAPGQSIPLQIQYSPTTLTAGSGAITITSNATIPVFKIAISAQGANPPQLRVNSSLTLPQMTIGGTATGGVLLVQNLGSAPLTVGIADVTGPFTQTNTCVRPLAARESCILSVRFAPTTAGAQQGTLVLTSNDPAIPRKTIVLSGTVLPGATKEIPHIGLSVDPSTVTTGQTITCTVVAASTGSGIPTGTVTIQDGGSVLGTATLSSGSGTYTGMLVGGFTHYLSASYSGDGAFATSATTKDVPVTVTGTDNSMTSTTSSQQVSLGGTVAYTLQLTPGVGNYPGPVSFSAQGLPAGFTVTFSPSSVTVDTSVQTVQMTLQAPSVRAQARLVSEASFEGPAVAVSLLLPLIGFTRRRKKMWLPALCLILISVAGCSSSSSGTVNQTPAPAQPTSYSISITATSGAVQHQTSVTLLW